MALPDIIVTTCGCGAELSVSIGEQLRCACGKTYYAAVYASSSGIGDLRPVLLTASGVIDAGALSVDTEHVRVPLVKRKRKLRS